MSEAQRPPATLADLADLAGLAPQTVRQRFKRTPQAFPRPLGRVGRAWTFSWTDAHAWAEEQRRNPVMIGRPRISEYELKQPRRSAKPDSGRPGTGAQ